MIDTHAHIGNRFIDPKTVSDDINIILAASNVEESGNNIKLAKNNKNMWASVGIHPQQTDTDNKNDIDQQINKLGKLIEENKTSVVAVGECGLDYSPAPPNEVDRSKTDQEKLFRGQISLADRYNLPLIIHARKAVDEAIAILAEYKNLRGVFHCFAGGKKRISKVLGLGDNWYFGIDGNLTYEDGLVEVVKVIPREKLLLETDSPFLTPVPFRGEENKPEYVKYVYQKVAEIWKINRSDVEDKIDRNASKLFTIDID